MNDSAHVLAINLDSSILESNEELNQWKDERIKSLRTPELSYANETNEKRDETVCKPLVPDLETPIKPTALTEAVKENENLKSKLLYVTKENTSLLQEMSNLKKRQMKLENDLREISAMEKLDVRKKDSVYAKLAATAKRQTKEIEHLKMDIQRLRSKCGHVSKDTMLCRVIT